MNEAFVDYIGQQHVLTRLDFYLKGYDESSIFPNTLFVSQKGNGKSKLVRIIAEVLRKKAAAKGFHKGFAEINCATIKEPEKFKQKFIQGIQNNHGTVFFDELHAMPAEICDWLLSVLESGNVVNTVNGVEYDFRKLTFLAATTEPQKLFVPFLNRFRVIQLCDYSSDEQVEILRKHLPNTLLEDDTAKYMVSFGRGNARSITDIAQEIDRYCSVNNIIDFSKDNAKDLIQILDMFPLGLSRFEVDILKIVRDRNRSSLTAMCASSGLTRSAQQDIETYLLRHGLIEIDQSSRRLTEHGQEYLNSLQSSPLEPAKKPSLFN